MRPLLLAAAVLLVVTPAIAGIKVSSWSVGQSRSGESRISLRLSKTKLGGFNLHNLSFTQSVWMYFLTLRGDRETYAKDQIALTNFDPRDPRAPALAIASGEVLLDRRKNKVMISLKIVRDGTIEDFPGNGTYDFP